jgi:hypothetical protein
MADDVSYEESSSEDWNSRAAQTARVTLRPSERAPDEIEVSGPCPRCGHETMYIEPLVLVSGSAPGADADLAEIAKAVVREQRKRDVTVLCDCGLAHAPDQRGCGAAWSLHVEWGD